MICESISSRGETSQLVIDYEHCEQKCAGMKERVRAICISFHSHQHNTFEDQRRTNDLRLTDNWSSLISNYRPSSQMLPDGIIVIFRSHWSKGECCHLISCMTYINKHHSQSNRLHSIFQYLHQSISFLSLSYSLSLSLLQFFINAIYFRQKLHFSTLFFVIFLPVCD